MLCNSTVSANADQGKQASNNYCAQVWGNCSNIPIVSSPFSASLQGQASTSNSTKITQYWNTQSSFCSSFGGASLDDSVCYDGAPVTFNSSGTLSYPSGMCLEKISNGSYTDMYAHPDGSSRAFFSNQQGQIWLATIPAQGSGAMMQVDVSAPFLDLSDLVSVDTELGLLAIAAHPNFTQNGRFFASYNCDKSKWPGCAGRCACNSAVNCDPSNLPADNGAQPCQYQSVISEFTVNGTSANISSVSIETRVVIFVCCFSPNVSTDMFWKRVGHAQLRF